jgi:hypothetical protein
MDSRVTPQIFNLGIHLAEYRPIVYDASRFEIGAG